MKVDRFWLWYGPFCAIIFGVIFAGVFYNMTNLKYDPLTGSSDSSQSFYVYNDGKTDHIISGQHNLPFSTNLPLTLDQGVCYGITFDVALTSESVTAMMKPVNPLYCGIGANSVGDNPMGIP